MGFVIGDKVSVFSQYHWLATPFGAPVSVKTVTRVGRRHLFLSDGSKWRLDGTPCGGFGSSQNRESIELHTEDHGIRMVRAHMWGKALKLWADVHVRPDKVPDKIMVELVGALVKATHALGQGEYP